MGRLQVLVPLVSGDDLQPATGAKVGLVLEHVDPEVVGALEDLVAEVADALRSLTRSVVVGHVLLQVGRLLEYLGAVGALVVLLVGVVHLVVEQLLPGGLEGDVALAGVDDVLAVVEVLGEGLVLGRVLVGGDRLAARRANQGVHLVGDRPQKLVPELAMMMGRMNKSQA